jgi:hypothetical protein
MVVNACNLNHPGGRGRKTMSLRPAWAKLAISFSKTKIKTKQLGT